MVCKWVVLLTFVLHIIELKKGCRLDTPFFAYDKHTIN